MPAPPTRLTSALLSTRALTPRSQTTILLMAAVALKVPAKQRRASATAAPTAGMSCASTIERASTLPNTDTPLA